MANYSMPGVTMTRVGSRLLGLVAFGLIIALGVAWYAYKHVPESDRMRIQLRTEQIGEGITPGTTVRLDGVAVGKITDVESIDQGRQLLSLDLDRSQASSLTDSFSVDYAPENLFGISAVTLRAAAGGTPLSEGTVVDLAGRVNDVTMGALLRSLTQTSTEVLTPKLTELLTQFNGDLRAFTPILETLVTLSRAIADTQKYPSSFLIDQYGAFFNGLGTFSSASFRLFDAIMNVEVFKNDREKFDSSIDMIANKAFPAIGAIGGVSGKHFTEMTDMFTPLLTAVAATVPNPTVSQAELTELIERLNRMFADGPNGPVVNVAVTLRGVPGIAVPLFGQQLFAALTAGGN
ncbi:MlaD family protein [Nocardia sp. NPDC051030]|uniref:MlaD family protein n=1 Tax=Nocardia sp. NPDC051030 TaxID=3155162 RepID=UPI003424CD12